MAIDRKIVDFYNQSGEESRLTQGLGPLEFERNKTLIAQFLCGKPALIVDVGGGPGHYAAWLAGLGNSVVLVEPVEKHIRQAKKRSAGLKNPFKCLKGDAAYLDIADGSADLVILHGPLYHLQDRLERLAALREAARVLKPGGVVLGFAISFTASSLAALQGGLMYHDSIFTMCMDELSSGRHTPPADFPGMLADAYFHRPSELKGEFLDSGLFEIKGIYAVEGMVWLDQQFFISWADAKKRRRMMEMLERTAGDEEMLAFSPHMMLAAVKV